MMIEISTRICLPTASILGLVLAGCGGSGGPGSADESDSQTSLSTISASDTGTGGGDTDTRTDTGTAGDASDSQGVTTADTGTGGDTDDDGDTTSGSSTSDDADDDSTSSQSNDDGPIPCEVSEATLEPVPPNIMLVLDKSRSMITNQWDHDEDQNTPDVTRWYSLYQVVQFVVTTFNDQINFGANLFPSTAVPAVVQSVQEACHTWDQPEIPVAPNNAGNILAGIPGPDDDDDIHGATPAAAGFVVARDHLLGLNPAIPRAIIFILDGAPNCMEGLNGLALWQTYDETLAAIVGEAWTNEGLPTYVVGIDISTEQTADGGGDPQGIIPWEVMNELAEAGGQPLGGNEKFYQTTNQNELQAALQQIIDDTLSCTVPLNPAPGFPELLEVYIDNMQVPEIADCDNEDGWMYTNANFDEIVLCGSWCGELKSTGAVKAEYYCNPA
jgi:hypothetical protein